MQALEDNFGDILGKARLGLGLSVSDVARRCGCQERDLQGWESGRPAPDDATIARLAETLRLHPARLLDSAHQRWHPPPVSTRPGNLLQIVTHFGGMLVNAYLIWDTASGDAAFFDTGTDFAALREPVVSEKLRVKYLFLTHTHADHIALLEEVRRAWKPEVVTSKGEYVPDASVAAEGRGFELGKLRIEVLETEGHSPGGLSYLVKDPGTRARAAIVGDALFAGSVGGPKFSYHRLLDNLRKKILTLPEDTVLAPGHGPLTTVGEEKAHNPFLV